MSKIEHFFFLLSSLLDNILRVRAPVEHFSNIQHKPRSKQTISLFSILH